MLVRGWRGSSSHTSFHRCCALWSRLLSLLLFLLFCLSPAVVSSLFLFHSVFSPLLLSGVAPPSVLPASFRSSVSGVCESAQQSANALRLAKSMHSEQGAQAATLFHDKSQQQTAHAHRYEDIRDANTTIKTISKEIHQCQWNSDSAGRREQRADARMHSSA